MRAENLIDCIRLVNTEGIGPVSFYKLLNQYGNAAEALASLEGRKEVFSLQSAEDELEKARKQNVQIITFEDGLYPENLKRLNDAPPILYLKGNPELLKHTLSVAIVGARNASVNGRKIASHIAYDLTNNDVLVVSGLASGIDAAAHKGALYAKGQKGPTIAVLGTGVDVCYPQENEELYNQIVEQGLIVSEFCLGASAQTSNFPRRNRIVSALALGTLVVEASLNSGSLITARLALEQGRDVFAVPGSPIEGKSAGANKLIKEGACLTECAEDILEVLNLSGRQALKTYQKQNTQTKPLDKVKKEGINNQAKNTVQSEAKILEAIGKSGLDQDELIRFLGLDAQNVMIKITELELMGLVVRTNGSFLRLTKEGLRQIR